MWKRAARRARRSPYDHTKLTVLHAPVLHGRPSPVSLCNTLLGFEVPVVAVKMILSTLSLRWPRYDKQRKG
jgi:hypothetical protein